MVSALALASCERVPLLAPTGSTITLTASTAALPLNGSTVIVAQVVEAAGTAPHAGTHVIFTTSLGSIQPPEAETDINGRATAIFAAGTASGTATITATSGGANTGTNGAVKIAIGAAAAANIALVAAPETISSGGHSTITATVGDAGGVALSGVPVTFSTDAGSVSSAVVNTDQNGRASTVLTSSKTANVTATAGIATVSGTTTTPAPSAKVTVTVNSLPTVTISSSTTNPTPNSPVSFTISAAPASGAAIVSIAVSYGDGAVDRLSGNATSVQHVYSTANTYTVTATATDNFGGVGSGSTVVVVGSGAIVASFTFSPSSPVHGAAVSFNASDSTPQNSITNYAWDFGDGSTSLTNTNPATSHTYATANTYTVHLTVTDSSGRTATTSKTITVS